MARNPTPLRVAIVMSGRTQREISAEIPGMDETRLSRIVNGLQCDQRTRENIAAALGRKVADLWPGLADEASLWGQGDLLTDDAAA